MEDMPRKTEAFIIFELNHTQSFELTELVRIGGMTKLESYKQRGDVISQRVTGVDLADYLQWSEEEKHSLDVPLSDLEELLQVTKEIQANDVQIQRLTSVTLPSVLLTYLFTIFEAYLNDVITIAYKANPKLLEGFIQTKSIQLQQNFLGKPIDEQVDYLLLTTDLKDVFKNILQKSLDLNLPIMWTAAKISYGELKKAKIIRNLYVHRGGLIDSDFIRAMGDNRLIVGETYPLTFSYLGDLSSKILFVAAGIDLLATDKYPNIAVR